MKKITTPIAAALAAALLAPAGAQDEKAPLPEGMMELKLELPEPLFAGTPTNIKSDNLEEVTGKPRPALVVPEGVVLLSREAEVTSSDEFPIIGDLYYVTDGDKEGGEGSYVELGPGKQWVQVDLGKPAEIHAIVVWHFHSQGRAYRDVVVQVADDKDFLTNVRTVFNNDHDNSSGLGIGEDKEYIETYEGRAIPVSGEKAQFIRLHSRGNTTNELNHYIEVEVFGAPVD